LHLEILAEEASLGEALEHLLPKMLPEEIDFKIHNFRGKENLLKKLPDRLKGYKDWIPEDWKIVVLIDEDRQNCHQLKQKLETIAQQSGFVTKSSSTKEQKCQVLNRIIIEELEAWFFGDVEAICQAYPGISPNLASQKKYRNPDTIKGGTWEALERVLKKAGYHQGGLEKVKAAREISLYMNPSVNQSHSFQVFYQGLLEII
jgi:hypothetical protein